MIWIAGIVYGLIFGALSVLRVYAGGVGVSDMAIYHTALLGATRGHFYFTYLVPEGCLLYQHFDPITILYLPFYLILGNSAWIILVSSQSFMAGLAFPALAAIGKLEGVKKRNLLLLLILLFFNPLLHNVLMYDFHPVSLSFPLILWGWYFNKRKMVIPGAICWGLAILCKENVPLTIAALGLSLILEKNHRFGVTWLVAGIVSFLVIVNIIIPSLRTIGEGNIYMSRYSWLGNSFPEIIRTLLLKPHLVAKALFSGSDRWNFLAKLLLPFGLFPLLAPRRFPALVPELGVLLLSSFTAMYSVKFHYPVVLLSVLFICSTKGLVKLDYTKEAGDSSSNEKERFKLLRNPKTKKFVFYFSVALALIATTRGIVRDDRALTLSSKDIKRKYAIETRRKTINKMANLIPSESSISLPLNLMNPTFPFCEKFERLSFLPDRWRVADYIILDMRTEFFGGHRDPGLEKLLEALLDNNNYELLLRENEFYLFKNLEPKSPDKFMIRDVVR